ncbi:MAG: hypothetical protein GY746_16205 [Gammaproteobacteria bacterium]|nr:hypothetical protein [Gammaproteobacteria bacterium]MCP4279737.1 hypothetical protein [Alteromonas sp.]
MQSIKGSLPDNKQLIAIFEEGGWQPVYMAQNGDKPFRLICVPKPASMEVIDEMAKEALKYGLRQFEEH